MLSSTFPTRRGRTARRLFLETLEDRTVPATISDALATGVTVGSAGPGIFDPTTATWHLRTTPSAGTPDAGTFQYGATNWIPVVGDWDGDGEVGIGVIDPVTNTWYLRNSATPGAPDAGKFQYGAPGWLPVVGDWDGNRTTDIGVVDLNTNTWYLRNSASPGAPDAGKFDYGAPGWLPVAGDWDGNGLMGIGVVDRTTNTWYLRNSTSPGAPDAGKFDYGAPGWAPVVGDWDGNGLTGIGVIDQTTSTWYLRNFPSAGAPDAGKFQYGMPGWDAVAGNFLPVAGSAGSRILTLKLNPLDIKLLGLEVQTSEIVVTVSAQEGQGKLLGNLLTSVSNLLKLDGVNNALNTVLSNVVTLLNSTSLTVNGVNTTSGPLSSSQAAVTPILDVFVAPVHLDLLGALVDTSPIHLTITARSGEGLVLGNVVTALANLFNPPLPDKLDLTVVNNKLQELLAQLNQQIPNIGSAATTTPVVVSGTDEILRLTVPPIDLNLLGLILKTSQIQVNADAQTGNGLLLGNVLTTLLNTLGATPDSLSALNTNLNALLAKVIGVLNASSLVLSGDAVSSLSQVLQTLALPNLVNSTGTASTPILDLIIASNDGVSPPVDVNLLGLVITTSNIRAQLLAQTGENQVLGNLLYNVANLLNPGGALSLIPILTTLGL